MTAGQQALVLQPPARRPGGHVSHIVGMARLLLRVSRARPLRSVLVLLALLLSALLEGIGLSAMLPVLSVLLHDGASTAAVSSGAVSGPGRAVLHGLERVGIEPTLGALILVVIGAIALKALIVLVANREVGYAVGQVATDLRLALIRALLTSRWSYFVRHPVGVFANAIASEARRASAAYLQTVSALAVLIQGLVYAVLVWLIDWKAGLAAVVTGVAFSLALGGLVGMARRSGVRQTRRLKALVIQLTDSLQSIKPLKVMGRETQAASLLLGQTLKLNRALRRAVLSKETLKAVQEPVIATLLAGGLYLSLVLWRLPVATVTMLLFVLARALTRLSKIQRFYQEAVICESAFWSIESTIREAEACREPATGSVTPALARDIRFENIGFAYDETPVLRDLSLTIEAGTLVVVVGASGVGKTTLIDLLAGLLEPQAGRILVDGIALGELDRGRWRRMLGYVPQETFLLHDTVIYNVTLGDPELTAHDAERALRAAGAWEFVSALPRGPETVVGERGSRLSGGQRQRLAIARALVHRPALLILDEATSALDSDSEMAICDTLRRLRGTLTILAVSHRPALTEAADRVHRLQGGTAVVVDRPEAPVSRARGEARAGAAPVHLSLVHPRAVSGSGAGSGV